MAGRIRIERIGPMASVQDEGRFGYLEHGISASGPMDAGAFARAGKLAGSGEGAAIEFSMTGLEFVVTEGQMTVGWAGGDFVVSLNGQALPWPGQAHLRDGDWLTISAGRFGNYGYVRFGGTVDVPVIMGSRSTSLRARIGGLAGRVLVAGDVLAISGESVPPQPIVPEVRDVGPIRFIWGLHAEVFSAELRQAFVTSQFRISSMMDRMGVRLRDEARVFENAKILSLVSDPVTCGDIQILGDGTPIILGRDHQPTGGYPRIGTVITADLDRFFQKRPNETVAFLPVGLDHAQSLLRGGTT